MRCLDEPVDVRVGAPDRADGPSQFVWRGRLYVVRSVVDHWRERRAWWRDVGEDVPPAEHAADPLAPQSLEHEIWRVEASAGRLAGSGVYDLRRTRGRWHLVRLAD